MQAAYGQPLAPHNTANAMAASLQVGWISASIGFSDILSAQCLPSPQGERFESSSLFLSLFCVGAEINS